MLYGNYPEKLQKYVGAKPGRVSFEGKVHLNLKERQAITWIRQNTGGIIQVLRPSRSTEMSADLRLGDKLLEIKHCRGTLITMDTAIRKAAKQSRGELIFLDVSGMSSMNSEIIEVAKHRAERCNVDGVIIVRGGDLIAFICKKATALTQGGPRRSLATVISH